MCGRMHLPVLYRVKISETANPYLVRKPTVRFRKEKSRLSQIHWDGVSVCRVVWSEHRSDKQRGIKSLLFAGKNKTPKIVGWSQPIVSKIFFIQTTFGAQTHFCWQRCTCIMPSRFQSSPMSRLPCLYASFPGHRLKGDGAPEAPRKYISDSSTFVYHAVAILIAHIAELDNTHQVLWNSCTFFHFLCAMRIATAWYTKVLESEMCLLGASGATAWKRCIKAVVTSESFEILMA